MRASLSLILGFALASAASAQTSDAYAQNPYGSDSAVLLAAAAPSASSAPAIDPVYELDPMAVISKAPGRYSRLTGTASRLDSNALRRMRPLGTQEALERVAGVQGFADDGFGNSRLNIGVRGLSPRRSSRVLILEDGIPIAPAVYLYPNMYYNPPSERIDEIEVIKGAAALEHGPQTMGGVVNYITRRPRKEFGGLAQVTGGEHGYGSAYAEVGGWGTETLRPELQLLYKRGDGYRQNNAFEQYNATFKLQWIATPRDALYLKLNANVEDAQATYTGLTEYSFKNDPDFNPKKHDTFDIRRYSVDLIHTRDLGYGLRTTKFYGSVFGRDWWRENDIFVTPENWRAHRDSGVALDPKSGIENTVGNLVRVGNGETNYGNLRTFYTLGLDNGWALYHDVGGFDATLSLGARVHWERFEDARAIGDAPDARRGIYFRPQDSVIVGNRVNYEAIALSLYAAEEVRLGRLTVRPGVRLEVFEQERIDLLRGSRYQDRFEYVALPGAGANYAITDQVNVFAGIHRGYTPPSTSTLDAYNFNAVAGSLDLRSEKSWNSELGARAANDWLALEVCGFHLFIEDIMAPVPGDTLKNLGAYRTYGAELSGSVGASRLNRFLPDAHFAYTWLQSEVVRDVVGASQSTGLTADISGNRLPYAPEHTLVAGLSRDFDFGLSLGAEAKFVSWVYTDYENLDLTENRGDIGPIDGYAVYDASASYARGRYRVFLNAKNLFDNVYVSSRLHSNPYSKDANVQGILVGPRRQVNLGASVAF